MKFFHPCPAAQLTLLESMSKRKFIQLAQCPLCRRPCGYSRLDQDDHIAEHLHSWALRALPWDLNPDDEASSDSPEMGSEGHLDRILDMSDLPEVEVHSGVVTTLEAIKHETTRWEQSDRIPPGKCSPELYSLIGEFQTCIQRLATHNRSKLRILVVEDNLVNIEVMGRMLKLEDVPTITVAKDGQEAYHIVQQTMENDQFFDVIFMDVQMPNVDGLQSTTLIRGIGCTSPIIALTAFSDESNVNDCIACGMNDFLAKPLRRPALKRILKRFAAVPLREESSSEAQRETVLQYLTMINQTKAQLSHVSRGLEDDSTARQRQDLEADLCTKIRLAVAYMNGEGSTPQQERRTQGGRDGQFLRDLYVTDPREDKIRIETAKGGLLTDVYRSILANSEFQRWHGDQQSKLLWVKGSPGTGKTMLLCGIINELREETDNNLSYFFCEGDDLRLNTATAVLRGLIYLLLAQQPSLISRIRGKYDYTGLRALDDANACEEPIEILTAMLDDPSLKDTILIVDALDECTIGLERLLEFITQPLRVKWIISSRNRPKIEMKLRSSTTNLTSWTPKMVAQSMLDAGIEKSTADRFIENDVNGADLKAIRYEDLRELNTQSFDLRTRVWRQIQAMRLGDTKRKTALHILDLNEHSISPAVDSYIYSRVSELIYPKNLDSEDGRDLEGYLRSDIDDTFLWVSTECQELAKPGEIMTWRTRQATQQSLQPGLKSIYKRMLDSIKVAEDADIYKEVLAILLITFRPITLDELHVLARPLQDFDRDDLKDVIGLCGDFLILREDVIRFVHQSARDYLYTCDGALSYLMPHGVAHQHHALFSRSLEVFSKTLRRDIYSMGTTRFPMGNIVPPRPDPLSGLEYSCVRWVDHLESSNYAQGGDIRVVSESTHAIYGFIQKQYLYWLEALSLLRNLPNGILAVQKLWPLMVSYTNAGGAHTTTVRRLIRFYRETQDRTILNTCFRTRAGLSIPIGG